MKKIGFIIGLLTLSFSQNGEVIGPELSGQALLNYIQDNYTTASTLGYGPARDLMYSDIDAHGNNQLSCAYTGYTITLDPNQDPSTNAYNQGINCEHTWPQSMGAGSEPQKSDMHHLFPSKDNVNSSRGNDPFGEIPDGNTDKWFRNDYYQTTIPTDLIDEYSEKENNTPQLFEPREAHKGDAARAMFYFYAIYNNVADANFWNVQKDVLLDWNYLDPVDQREYERTQTIASHQNGIPNPFVIDSTLARRIWFYTESVSVEDNEQLPQGFTLEQNYPNPFNPQTEIGFSVEQAAFVKLSVYNIFGQRIIDLVDGYKSAGHHKATWNGQDESGSTAAAGVYFCKLESSGSSQVRKMLLVK